MSGKKREQQTGTRVRRQKGVGDRSKDNGAILNVNESKDKNN
jgi:hypothetical protein